MAEDPARVIDSAFLDSLLSLSSGRGRGLDELVAEDSALSCREALALFGDQAASRHLDLAARQLRARGEGFYTIGSSGHEGNAAVAAALRPSDPALIHYRSGAFYLARARQVPGSTPILDVLLGLCGSRDEPIAGGRHKVFGNARLCISPQTSTIASHLPRAVGLAFAIERAAAHRGHPVRARRHRPRGAARRVSSRSEPRLAPATGQCTGSSRSKDLRTLRHLDPNQEPLAPRTTPLALVDELQIR